MTWMFVYTRMYVSLNCIALAHAHLITSSGVQLILGENQLYYFSMTIHSCPVEHGETSVVSAMEQGCHLRGQVANGFDMATPCS